MNKEYFQKKDMEVNNLPWKPSTFKKLQINHIEDENKSVKWNREFVEKNNENYKKEVSRLQSEKTAAYNALKDEIILTFMKEEKITKEQAQIIYRKSVDDSHSYGISAILDSMDEYIEFFNDMIKAKKRP